MERDGRTPVATGKSERERARGKELSGAVVAVTCD